MLWNIIKIKFTIQKKKSYDASKKSKEKVVFYNLKDKRQKQRPNFKIGQLVWTADIEKKFSKGDSTFWAHKFSAVTELIYESVPSYRINYLPKRYNENLLRSTNLTLDETNQVLKKNVLEYYDAY